MKTVKQCMNEMQDAWLEYDAALECWGNIQESYVMVYVRRIWELAAELEEARLYAELRNLRVEANALSGEVNTLKDANLTLSCQLSEQTGITAELQIRVNGLMENNRLLIKEASVATVNGNSWADISIGSAEMLQESQTGLKTIRDRVAIALENLGVKPTKKGVVEDIEAIEEMALTLRQVNQSRDEVHVIQPETVELLKKISNSPGVNALWIATDKLSLATFRAWWYSHTEDERRAELYSVSGDLITEPSNRGTAWIKITRELAANPKTFVGPLPMEVGKTGTVDHIVQKGNNTVTVGTEQRGPEWGKGRAKKAFEDLRAHNASIPRGKRVAHELSDKSLFLPDEDLPNVG